jgi:predicted DNA-binding protein with PD1-like motif
MQKDSLNKRQMIKGKLDEVIYARLERGEDLLHALWDICRQNDVRTGVLLDVTGSLDNARIMRIPEHPRDDNFGVDFVDVPGPLEVSGHGIIGMGWVLDKSVTPPHFPGGLDTGFGPAGFLGHEAPYLHVHITVSSSTQTVCGHLLEGSYTGRDDKNIVNASRSHFTVAIGKVSGAILRATWDETGYFHDLVQA